MSADPAENVDVADGPEVRRPDGRREGPGLNLRPGVRPANLRQAHALKAILPRGRAGARIRMKPASLDPLEWEYEGVGTGFPSVEIEVHSIPR